MTDPDVLLDEIAERLRSPFDPVLTDPTRLRLQAAMHALPAPGAMSFTALRKAIGLTDGNTGKHLEVLVAAGFVETDERWQGRRRTTRYRATATGRAAFEAHVRALRLVTGVAEPG